MPTARALLLSLAVAASNAAAAPIAAVPAVPAAAVATAQEGLTFEAETYRLNNGLLVTLHQDRSLPQVVIDTWYWVGSKDEEPERTGFAHLFEHLMFMGTARVPGNSFDVIMESGGGSNNASTSQDRTNYYSFGPSGLLETLLWLDADRLEAFGANMTQEKLDAQREVVRNERRQTSENTPYGRAELLVPELMYPSTHPYHHTVIGSHEHLEAATLDDVVSFFNRFYTTTNASLVVAGDFEIDEAKAMIERTFGAVARREPPTHMGAPLASLDREIRRVEHDAVQFAKLSLAWHSPAYMKPGDGEMDLLASLLAEGSSSRLVRRLVQETRLAQDVYAYQSSGELGSLFRVEVIAADGADLEEIKAETLAVIDELLRTGPGADELAQVQATTEAGFLRRMESLFARADRMNLYLRTYGEADGFQRDLERWSTPTPADVAAWGRRVITKAHLDLRVLPDGVEAPDSWRATAAPLAWATSPLDTRPDAGETAPFNPPLPVELELACGARLLCFPRPGSGLFAGAVYGAGGPGSLPAEKRGLAVLAATMLEQGAAGLSAAEFAAAVDGLGASIGAGAGRYGFTVSVSGLSSKLDATLDRFRDIVRRPNLAIADFEREKALHAAAVAARADEPNAVAGLVARALAFGANHPSGAPLEGFAETVAAIEHADVAPALGALLHAGNAVFVFAGDFEPGALKQALDARFRDWARGAAAAAPAAPITAAPAGRLAVVDRPGAAQTTIMLLRPLPEAPDRLSRVAADCVGTLFGGSFTSRLNQNLRERNGFTYGAGAGFREERDQHYLIARTSVHTPVTGAALRELKAEFDGIAGANVTAAELEKARETVRAGLVSSLETTGDALALLRTGVANGHALDETARELRALDQVTLAHANVLVTKGFFDWDTLQVVLVGDREAILPQLAAEGFSAPVAVTAEGRLAGED